MDRVEFERQVKEDLNNDEYKIAGYFKENGEFSYKDSTLRVIYKYNVSSKLWEYSHGDFISNKIYGKGLTLEEAKKDLHKPKH